MVQTFFEAIALDTGMIVFGVVDTMKALEMSALTTILLYDEIEIMRYEIQIPGTDTKKVHYLTKK